MADQGRWFKLWYEALSDPDLANLSIADFGRWAKFGVYVKAHGTDGSIRLVPPCRVLLVHLELMSFKDLIACISSFPNVEISRDDHVRNGDDVTITAKIRNWRKYQIDSSAERQRRYRHRQAFGVTTKKRREEKRREEKRDIQSPQKETSPNQKTDSGIPAWPAEDLWLEEFLKTQKLAPVPEGTLFDHAWWEQTSISSGGLDQPTLEREFAKIGAWCKENPSRVPRPTEKSWKRFVRGWLERSYDHERRFPNGTQIKGKRF